MMTFPADFESYMRRLLGRGNDTLFLHAMEEEPPVSLRLNPFKVSTDAVGLPDFDARVPWCSEGVYLRTRPPFTFDPLLHAGCYYVQEASSMFLHRILRQYVTSPVTMLDLCAAPGGKSTVARAALPAGSLLFCNEPVRSRAAVLTENLMKYGHPDVVVSCNSPVDYHRSGLLFDVILADVPCSGEGMFRKDESTMTEWSVQNVTACSRRQRDIVSETWHCLRGGGLFIYSTCTFNTMENEENVAWIVRELGAEVLPVDVEPEWGITGSLLSGCAAPVYRFLPGKTRGEGLFVAVLRKPDEGELPTHRSAMKGKTVSRGDSARDAIALSWLKDGEAFVVHRKDDKLVAVPRAWAETYHAAESSLRIIHAGITLGTQKGKDLIPAPSLALSVSLSQSAFPRMSLTYGQAMSYLRRETVTLSSDTLRGFVLLTFNGIPIGWAKHLGNRTNNLYPQEWRVKSSHIPQHYHPIITI